MLDNLELIGTGFAVVLMVLALIWGATASVGYFFTRVPKAEPAAKAPNVPAAAAVSSGIPPHHLAAIAAAVAHTLGGGYLVTRVAAPGHKVSEWPMEGRMETFSSRRTRTDWGPTRPTLGGKTPNTLRGQQK